jgi:hypothetical protein
MITISNSSCITLFYPLQRECVFGEPLVSNGLPRLFVAAGTYVIEPLPTNGHIRHNMI